MATLSDLKAKILRILSDTGAMYSDDLIFDGVRAALEEILPWVPKQLTTTFTGDGAKYQFDLPADCYRVVAILDEDTGLYLPASAMGALQSPGMNIDSNQDWVEFPEGSISFANILEKGKTATVYYDAYWAVPDGSTAEIEAPLWLHRALCYYACSYILLSTASSFARINQWDVKSVDSGSPVDNPVKDMSTYFYDRFLQAMKMVPGRIRGSRG